MIDARENINPYELRLGNWVEDEDDSHLQFQVDHIEQGKDLVSDLVFINGRHHLAILPIPLTPEILEKVGFVKLGENEDDIFYKLDYGFLFGKQLSISGYFEADGLFVTHGKPELKYLHQLQNLFFSLYGKELEIKI